MPGVRRIHRRRLERRTCTICPTRCFEVIQEMVRNLFSDLRGNIRMKLVGGIGSLDGRVDCVVQGWGWVYTIGVCTRS